MPCCEIIPNFELSCSDMKDEGFDANKQVSFTKKILGNYGKFSDKRWDKNYSDLLEFICIHGHSNVPSVYKKNPRLGGWVTRLRKNYRLISQGKTTERMMLTEKRILMLDQINFNWDPKGEEFNFFFSKLMRYKQIHGHVHIHASDIEDADCQNLLNWIKSIRSAYVSFSKGIPQKYLTHERVMKLEELNFQWKIADGKSNYMSDYFPISVTIIASLDWIE